MERVTVREIKFRVWDKFGMHDWNNMVKCLYQSTHFDEFENIMQFTGLFDKHGVEIYEGDIIRCKLRTDKEYWLAEVKWSIDAWCLGLHTISSYVDIEVIGNIYENPELLN